MIRFQLANSYGEGARAPPVHDVAIISVESSATEVHSGQIVNITAVAQNKGEAVETFNVTAYADDISIGTQTVNQLAPNECKTLTFSWNTAGVTLYINYTIRAQATPIVGENSTQDNVVVDGRVRVKIQGDVNDDELVDIKDVAQAALAFGSYLNHLRWNPQADTDGDSKVDIKDIALIAKNFGKTYP